MNTKETLTLILQSATFLILLLGLIVTIIQLSKT